jgi:two-component system sensor histidine kinase RpfC
MSRQPMNALRFLKTRLRARADSEHEQALVRLSFVGLVLACVALIGGRVDIEFLLAGYLGAAAAIFAAICAWPAPNATRRVIGMILDVGAVTWFLWFAGGAGMSIIGVYFFLIFGNGFRYGHWYLILCQVLCLAGFFAVLLAVPYWQAHVAEGLSLMLVLVVVPLYVSVLLQRLQQAHAKAEQALKDCIERQARPLPSSH